MDNNIPRNNKMSCSSGAADHDRNRALWRRLLPALAEAASSADGRVAHLALEIVSRALAEHMGRAA
jgi:hypothetical protein